MQRTMRCAQPCCPWQLLALLSLSVVSAIQPFRAIDVLNPQQDEQSPVIRGRSSDDDVKELYIEQQLDHFSDDDSTFRQRYFYTSRYAEPTDGPTYAFLCVGGEGPSLNLTVLVDSVHCSGDMIELARILHEGPRNAVVHLFALEHRYYGDSYPSFTDQDGNQVSPVTNENLVYLSSRQAQEDLAHFIRTMNDMHSLEQPKWITFGGSYPGMNAAWARLLHPELVHAAVSSSAPIQIQLDMASYNDLVSYDLQYPTIGGSSDCLQVVMDGHFEIVEALAAGRPGHVATLFNFCDADSLLVEKNVDMWLGDGVIHIPAQSNDPVCEEALCNIDKICDTILHERNKSTPMEVLASVWKMQRGKECSVLDWNATLQYISSPKAQKDGLRSWLWQTCTEFGFYQTCEEASLCPYGRGYHTLEMDFEICERAFGVDRKAVAENVEKSLKHYGGRHIDATRILSVNGNVDPWSTLALTTDRKGLPTHWVKGASHHFWTHPVKDTDSQEIKDARDIIYLKVMEWLDEETDVLLDEPSNMKGLSE